jgi:hypothetical protein
VTITLKKTKNLNDGLQLKDKTAYADLVNPSQELYFFEGLLFCYDASFIFFSDFRTQEEHCAAEGVPDGKT